MVSAFLSYSYVDILNNLTNLLNSVSMYLHSISRELDQGGEALQFPADLFQQGGTQHVEPEHFHI